jgi:PAS domain S-box-containing protein
LTLSGRYERLHPQMNPDPSSVNQASDKVRLFFVLMSAVLILGIAASYFAGRAALESIGRIREFDAAIEAIQDLRSTVQDAETGQRGYLLTRQASYLGPYEEALATIQPRLQAVHKLAKAGLVSQEQMSELERLVETKIEELRKTVSLVQAGRMPAAMQIVRSAAGEQTMESLRAVIAEIVSVQENGRAVAGERADAAVEIRGWVFLGAILLNLAFLWWAYQRIRREMMHHLVANLETRRQKEILAVTLASIGDAVIITDTKGRITFLNAVAEKLTGWSAKEAKERPCAEVFRIVNEETRLPVESPVDKVLARGAIVGLANHTVLIRRDGSELPIDDSGAPIRESDGTVRGVVLIFRDFTAHKESERRLVRAKEEMETSSKAKDKFLASLSHELRTPLTPLLATLSSWEASNALPVTLRTDLQRLRRSVELEARLIDDLLDLTRIENGKLSLEKEPVDVHNLIHSAAAHFREEAQARGLRLHCQLDAKNSWLEADPARLQQILLNLIGNAVKFSRERSPIEMVTSNPQGTELNIAITDHGIGMPEELIARLFQRFEQGEIPPEIRFRGLGLGLSIAKALVEAHGGALRAESKGPGCGSTFTISFPEAHAPARTSAQTAAPAAPPRSDPSSLHVLVVEDHEDTARVLEKVLRQMGHEVEACSTVATACQKLQERQFDVILTDIGLPDGSGIDFIKVARGICQTPAVALTGYGTAEDIDKCLQAGFEEHLTKPIDIDRLQKALSRILAKRSGSKIEVAPIVDG